MKMSVMERLILMGLLPKENDFATLKIIRELQGELSFSEADHKELNFKNNPGGGSTWSASGAEKIGLKKIDIGDKAKSIIVDELKKLNDQKKITNELFDIYERFVEKGD